MAARPRTLPAAVAPVLVGTALRRRPTATFHAARVRRRAARRAVHPGRDEPLERLLRRAPRRRHRGPARPGARDRRRARAAAPGAGRDLRRVRRSRSLCGVYLIVVAGWELLLVGAASILAGVLYTGGPRPVRLRGPRRGVRLPVLRRRRRRRLLLRAGRAARVGGVRARGAGRAAGRGDPRGQQRPRPRDRPARGQADARGAARARRARAALFAAMVDVAFLDRAAAVARSGSLSAWLLLPLAGAAARRAGSCGPCAPAPTARR